MIVNFASFVIVTIIIYDLESGSILFCVILFYAHSV